MDERLQFLQDGVSDRFTMSELCARYGVSRRIAAGGWRDTETLLTCYLQADTQTLLAVMAEERKVHEQHISRPATGSQTGLQTGLQTGHSRFACSRKSV